MFSTDENKQNAAWEYMKYLTSVDSTIQRSEETGYLPVRKSAYETDEFKKFMALAALDYAEKMIPAINVPYDWANGAFQMAESYYQLGQNEKANKIIDELANKSLEYMIWYLSLNDNQLAIAGENFVYNASLLDAEVRLMEKYKSEELAKHYSTQLDQLYNEYVTRMKGK